MSQIAVEVDNVTKTYDDLVAVDRVTLTVGVGETLGLIGPNGAGKTSLLRIISTLSRPDSGDVRIAGYSASAQPRDVRTRIGFMPAEFGCPRSLSIQEYLDYFSCMHGVPSADRQSRIQDVCELTDLKGREDVAVKGLSTGNRQRLLLAKTLLHDPSVLILDEPASGLDPRARTELRSIIRTLASLGKAIIISSHILPDIEGISDRIGIMEAGRLVMEGNLENLRTSIGATQRSVRLKVPPDDIKQSLAVLRAVPGVRDCELRDQTIVASLELEHSNVLLRALLDCDIRIQQFSENEVNLEEIFMRTTVGKVT